MIEVLLSMFIAIVFAVFVLYFLFPRSLFNFLRIALRWRGGMRRKTVLVGDLSWPYLEGGPADGEVMVLVHGFGGDKDNWTIYAPQVTRRYRLIAPDLPGFGDNDRAMDRDYTIPAQTARLRDFLDALGIDRCHLGGNSMGGYIALRFAVDYPERLRSLTLFDNGGVTSTRKSELELSVDAGTNPLDINSLDDMKRMMAFGTYKPIAMPKAFLKLLYEDGLVHKKLLDKIFWTLAKLGLGGDLNADLPRVKTPTLIIWGREDRIIDVSCVEVLKAGIPGSRSVILEKTGHVPMIERPAAAARHHLDFLRTL